MPEEVRRSYSRGSTRKRGCYFCNEHIRFINYKDIAHLALSYGFLSDRAKIEARRKKSTCAKHQRKLSRAIKQARTMALLPYTAGQLRSM